MTLFVVGLRHLGTARTGAYFSVAPFLGALLAIALGEPATVPLALAGACMAAGVWLHLTERHVHEHAHEALEHTHERSTTNTTGMRTMGKSSPACGTATRIVIQR